MNSKKDCAGTYPVSGYVKKDGTEVSSYMRTCGAKHGGKNVAEKFVNMFQYASSAAPMQYYGELLLNLNEPYHKYYKLSLDFEKQKMLNKDNFYSKFGFIQNDKIGQFIINNCNIDNLTPNTDIIIPILGSPLVDIVNNSDELKSVLKEKYDKILKGEYKNKYFDVNFNQTKDAHLTLGKAKLYNMRVVDDYICGTLIDYYDFDKLKYKFEFDNFSNIYSSFKNTIANNNAYYQQEANKLTNYIILMAIKVDINKLFQ